MQSFSSIHAVVSEEKIFEKVYGRRTTDAGRRRTQSDDKSSHCLRQGELKISLKINSRCWTGICHLIFLKTYPTIWHMKTNNVTKFQAAAMSGCWENCYRNFKLPKIKSRKINKVVIEQEVVVGFSWNLIPPYGIWRQTMWQNFRQLRWVVAEKTVTEVLLGTDGHNEGHTDGRTEVKHYTPLSLQWGYN